jgi:hypothetical protein
MASYLEPLALGLLKDDGIYDSIGANWYKVMFIGSFHTLVTNGASLNYQVPGFSNRS